MALLSTASDQDLPDSIGRPPVLLLDLDKYEEPEWRKDAFEATQILDQ